MPGTIQYNKENFGNVVAIDTPEAQAEAAPDGAAAFRRPAGRTTSRRTSTRMGLRLRHRQARSAAGTGPSSGEAAVDPVYQSAFTQIFDGAGITQYKLTNFRGKDPAARHREHGAGRVHTLSAPRPTRCRDAFSRGNADHVKIVLTTSSGEPAGTLDMSPEQARLLVDKNSRPRSTSSRT